MKLTESLWSRSAVNMCFIFVFLLFPFPQGFAEATKIWKASSKKCYRAKNITQFLVALSVLKSFGRWILHCDFINVTWFGSEKWQRKSGFCWIIGCKEVEIRRKCCVHFEMNNVRISSHSQHLNRDETVFAFCFIAFSWKPQSSYCKLGCKVFFLLFFFAL